MHADDGIQSYYSNFTPAHLGPARYETITFTNKHTTTNWRLVVEKFPHLHTLDCHFLQISAEEVRCDSLPPPLRLTARPRIHHIPLYKNLYV